MLLRRCSFQQFQVATSAFCIGSSIKCGAFRWCSSSSSSSSSSPPPTAVDEDADMESVETATGIARTLRNYRQAVPEGTWVDLENLMSSKYVTTTAPSSSSSSSSSSSAPKLRPLQTAEEIISGSGAFRAAGLELRPELLVRLKRPRRAANVLIDTDGLTPQQAADIVSTLNLQEEHSTISVVRQASSLPSFGSTIRDTCRFRNAASVLPDEIVPALGTSSTTASSSSNSNSSQASSSFQLPTYMLVERLAAKLVLAHTVVLNDVVYICSDANLSIYCDHVANATPFLDADVFVCTPSRTDQVHFKMPMPTVSPTMTVPCGK